MSCINDNWWYGGSKDFLLLVVVVLREISGHVLKVLIDVIGYGRA